MNTSVAVVLLFLSSIHVPATTAVGCDCALPITKLLAFSNGEMMNCFETCFYMILADRGVHVQVKNSTLNVDEKIFRNKDLSKGPSEITSIQIHLFKGIENGTWIALNPEAKAALSFYGRKSLSCSVYVQNLSNIETKICCLSENISNYKNESAFTKIGTLNKQQTIVRFEREKWSLSPLFDVRCFIDDNIAQNFRSYPLEFKSPPGAKLPGSDINLKVYLTKHTSSLFRLDIYWDCPSFWAGEPGFYTIACRAVENHEALKEKKQLELCFSLSHWGSFNQNCGLNQVHWNTDTVMMLWANHSNYGNYASQKIYVTYYSGNPIGFQCAVQAVLPKREENMSRRIHGKMSEPVFVSILNDSPLDLINVETSTKTIEGGTLTSRFNFQKHVTFQNSEFSIFDGSSYKDQLIEPQSVIRDSVATLRLSSVLNVSLPENFLACYDWLNQWWFLVGLSKEKHGQLASGIYKEEEVPIGYTVVFIANIPKSLVCIPSKSQIFWIEKERDEFKLFFFSYDVKKLENGELKIFKPEIAMKRSENNCPATVTSGALDASQYFLAPKLHFVAHKGIVEFDISTFSCKMYQDAASLSKCSIKTSDILDFTVLGDTIYLVKNLCQEIFEVYLNSCKKILLVERFTTVSLDYHDLHNYPGFPRKVAQTFMDIKTAIQTQPFIPFTSMVILSSDKIEKISRADLDISLADVPMECFYPQIKSILIHPLSNTNAIATIYMMHGVSRLFDCAMFATNHPVKYAGFIGMVSNTSYTSAAMENCYNCPRTCDKRNRSMLDCRSIATGPTWQDHINFTLSNLIQDKHYVMEMTPVSLFNYKAFVSQIKYGPPISIETETGTAVLGTESMIDVARFMKIELEKPINKSYICTFQFQYAGVQQKDYTKLIIGISVPLAVVLVVLIALITWFYKKRWHVYQHLRRITADQLTWSVKLGEGNFGSVWKALLTTNSSMESSTRPPGHQLFQHNQKTAVAVKLLKETASEKEKRQFIEEAVLLSKLSSDFIVRPSGICMSKPVILVLEFLNGGSLDQYLLQEDVRQKLKLFHLLEMGRDISRACKYLEQMQYVHRDISAKNCLVQLASDQKYKKLKLADFGLAKDCSVTDVYNVSEDSLLPIPYTAPEGLLGSFSMKSDVYSFGILMWEIFSWCAQPYGKCRFNKMTDSRHLCPLKEYTMAEIQHLVVNGRTSLADLDVPCCMTITDPLKALISLCCSHEAAKRPTFTNLEMMLHEIASKKENLQKGFPQLIMESSFQAYMYQTVVENDTEAPKPVPAYSEMESFAVHDGTKSSSVDITDVLLKTPRNSEVSTTVC